jgi:hypothetical protein
MCVCLFVFIQCDKHGFGFFIVMRKSLWKMLVRRLPSNQGETILKVWRWFNTTVFPGTCSLYSPTNWIIGFPRLFKDTMYWPIALLFFLEYLMNAEHFISGWFVTSESLLMHKGELHYLWFCHPHLHISVVSFMELPCILYEFCK